MDLSEIYRRFLQNAGKIVAGRVVFGLLNLGTNVLVVRSFGLADLGVVLLLQSYVRLFSEIVKFQSWQAVLRYGAVLQEADDRRGMRRLLGFTLGVDIVSLVLAVVMAILLIPQASVWFDWTGPVADFAPFFVLSIIFITHATPTGVLRLYDRVGTLVMQHTLNAVIRFALVLLAILFEGNVFHLVLAWFAASVISGLWVIVVCLQELARRRLLPIMRVNWFRASREFAGVWRFLAITNLASASTLVVNYGTTLVVGAQLGAAAAATFEVARQFGAALSRPARLLGPLIFPDLAKLSARGDWVAVRSLMKRQLMVTGGAVLAIGVIMFAFLPLIVDLLFGDELMDNLWLFRLLILGGMISVMGFAIQPAFLSANKAGTLLLIQFAAIVVFIVVAWTALNAYGLNAVGFGLLSYAITLQTLAILIGRKVLKKRIRKGREAAAKAAEEQEERLALGDTAPPLPTRQPAD